MISFLEIGILLICVGGLLFLFTLTSYSCRVNVTGEKKGQPARYGIDYVTIAIKNYFSSQPPALVTTEQEFELYKQSFVKEGLRHRKEGGAVSPQMEPNEKFKFL
jgi:hypothetical protein